LTPITEIHVSDRLLEIRDGAFLELGLKGIVGQVIQLPPPKRISPIATGWPFGFSSSRDLGQT
jgi:hypothetical protein